MCTRGLFCSEKLNPLRGLSLSVFRFSERSALLFHGLSVFRLFFWLFVNEAVILGLVFLVLKQRERVLDLSRAERKILRIPPLLTFSLLIMWCGQSCFNSEYTVSEFRQHCSGWELAAWSAWEWKLDFQELVCSSLFPHSEERHICPSWERFKNKANGIVHYLLALLLISVWLPDTTEVCASLWWKYKGRHANSFLSAISNSW